MVSLSFLNPFSLFRPKYYIRAQFIDEAGQEFTVKKRYENNTFTLKVGGNVQTYYVDKTRMRHNPKDRYPICTYYTNNPYPLELSHKRPHESAGEVDAISLTSILENKVIQDLFAPEGINKMLIIMILLIVNLFITFTVLGVQNGWIKLHN